MKSSDLATAHLLPASQGVRSIARITRNIEELTVETLALSDLPYPNLQVVLGEVAGLDIARKQVQMLGGQGLAYDKAGPLLHAVLSRRSS